MRVNEQIVAREVRVIGNDGQQIGILPLEDARDVARTKNLDLVEIASTATPPVCRVMDHGKFMFERQKRERDRRKSQTRIEVKEVRLSPRTGQHDVDIALGKIRRFVGEGAKVKVRIRFRGRERQNPAVGIELLQRIAGSAAEFAKVETEPAPEGNTIFMTLSPPPRKGAVKAAPARES